MKSVISSIRSGGQTGSDRGALDAARERGVPICGWCPQGGWAEDREDPPGLLVDYPELRETPSSDVLQRTEWNVRDSDATLIFGIDRAAISKGTDATVEFAKKHGKPHVVIASEEPAEILAWLDEIGQSLNVNVAGPRESESPGSYDASFRFVQELLKEQETAGEPRDKKA